MKMAENKFFVVLDSDGCTEALSTDKGYTRKFPDKQEAVEFASKKARADEDEEYYVAEVVARVSTPRQPVTVTTI